MPLNAHVQPLAKKDKMVIEVLNEITTTEGTYSSFLSMAFEVITIGSLCNLSIECHLSTEERFSITIYGSSISAKLEGDLSSTRSTSRKN
jgi:hypothetical protein